jgi:hypothetical protein
VNISRCTSSLIQQLGLYNVNLPFKEPTEKVIQNILKTTTIPEYSEFVPWIKQDTVDIRALKCVNPNEHIYILPGSLTMTPVKYVSDVAIPSNQFRGSYGAVAPSYGITRAAQGVATGQAAMMLVGQMRSEPTFEYLGYNQIRLYAFPKSLVTFKVACEHLENGESIEPSCYDSFMQLALLDVKMFLYNNLKLYDGITTAFGTIQLKTDEFQSAESDRNALLEDWRNTFHLDNIDWIEWM